MVDPKILPRLTLVIGGARSGKSGFAEGLFPAGTPATYIATAEAHDAEMRLRIDQHRARRDAFWQTVEAPHDLSGAISRLGPPAKAALIDCATLWLSNRLLAEADLEADCAALVTALTSAALPLVVVSNEVGWSIVPENALARAFRDAQGRLNQMIAARADLVVAVMAGLPMVLKGTLPITDADRT
jgi:adenosylcobinamide kinase/adenosylcobinamide-phosphate guanylyltransferase